MFQTRCPEHQSPWFIHTADTERQGAHYQVSAFSHMPPPGYMSKEELLHFELSTEAASKQSNGNQLLSWLTSRKGKKKFLFLNQHFPYTSSHFRNLCWDPPTISNSDHYLSGLDLNWFTAQQTKQVIYVRWIEAYHRETWRKEMELLAMVHIKGQRWIYAIGILCWKSAGKSSTDLGMLLWRGNRAPSCSVLNWGGQCLRKAQERVILT